MITKVFSKKIGFMHFILLALIQPQVLEQRHSQELQDLNTQCEAEKTAVLTEAMAKLQSEHDTEREKIQSQYEQEINNLLSQGADLTPAQLEERKLHLLNSQQQQLKLVKYACVLHM